MKLSLLAASGLWEEHKSSLKRDVRAQKQSSGTGQVLQLGIVCPARSQKVASNNGAPQLFLHTGLAHLAEKVTVLSQMF